jgi:transcription initiation factor TFIID subunit 2
VYPVPTEHLDDSTAAQPLMHAFCLPGHETQLVSSVTFLRSAMNFFTSELGSYPFNSHKLVFVDELPTQRFDTSTMSLCHIDLLHGEDAIDQVYETRLLLSHALACQWVGINIQAKTPSDTWLINGLNLYVTSCYLRKLFGINEHRYRIKKDMDRVLEWDNGNMPPICQPQNIDAPEGAVLNFVNLKAPLVLHILDRRLSKSGTSLGLSRVLPKLFLQAMSGELPNNQLSTHAFLRLCRKVSGMDPRSFAEQWIYGSGFPSFQFQASFNRKKMAVEILMRQECPAHKLHENDEVGKALFKPVPFFEGQMTIRIHEADGTPYEHVLDIRAPFKRFEVPFNTKYKRVRRNTKRYMARQAAAQAAAEGEEAPANAPLPGELVDVGFAVEIWDNDRERDNWKISEWTEEDEQRMAGATYEWIRLDVDLEWITAITFEQPDFMWVSQLQRDRDVVAQLEVGSFPMSG